MEQSLHTTAKALRRQGQHYLGLADQLDVIARAVTTLNGSAAAALAPPVPPRVVKNTGGRPKGYKMSEATKAKLRAAWKRRKKAGV